MGCWNHIVHISQRCAIWLAVTWWRHRMDIFSALLALCEGNPPVTGGFPSQRPVTRSFDIFFDLHLNKRLSKQSRRWWLETPSCSLWCHCNEVQISSWNWSTSHSTISWLVDSPRVYQTYSPNLVWHRSLNIYSIFTVFWYWWSREAWIKHTHTHAHTHTHTHMNAPQWHDTWHDTSSWSIQHPRWNKLCHVYTVPWSEVL